MNSFTGHIYNKALLFRLKKVFQLAIALFFLISFQKSQAQCPVATPISSITICSGTTISITLSSDQDPFTTFSWTAVQTDVVGAIDGSGLVIGDTLTAADVFQGTVDYTVTPFTVGCPGGGIPIVVTVVVNPIPLAIATPLSSTICSGATSAVILTSDVAGTTFAWTVTQAGVTGGTDDAGGTIAQTLTNPTSSLGIATYNITPTADGCVGEAIDAKVKVRAQPSLTLGANPEVCQGTLTADLSYSASSGSPNQYSVDFDAIAEGQGFVDVVNAVLPASPIVLVVPGGAAVGVYNAVLSVTNTVNGCTGLSYPITVTVSAPTPQIITGTSPICVGSTAVWTSTTPGGTWTSASPGVATVGAVSGLVTGISAGTSDITYSVTIGGCVNTAMQTVTITASTPQIITGTSPICVGSTALWTSTTPGGTWSSASPGVATIGAASGLVTGISAGTSDITYSITIGGCVNTAMQTVTISDPTPQVITGTTPLCVGATAVWTSTTGGGTWSSASPGIATVGAASGLVTAVSVGTSDITYSVTIGGCINTAIKTVTVNSVPTLVINDPVAICSPATVDLTAGAVTAGSTGGLTFTYFTDPGATLVYGTPTTATAGTYYIVGTAIGGCADTAAVNVTVDPKPTLLTTPQSICSPAVTVDLTLPAVTAGSTPGLIFSYFTDPGATSVYGTPTAATSGTYYIVGTLGGTCSDTAGVTVTVNPGPTVVTNDQTVCSPATVDLTAPAITLGSTGGLTFSYFTDPGATISYPTPTAATAGTYYIVGATAFGCYDTAAVIITVNTTPIVVTVPQTACSPSTINLTLPAVTAGSTPGLTFTYYTDAGATTPYLTPTLATNGTYYIVGTLGGCSDTTAVTVTINPKPNVLTNNPATVCAPATVDLTLAAVTAGSTAGLSFTYFTDAAATISYPTPSTATSGTYYIVGSTLAGCSDTAAVTVTITPKPVVVTTPQTACTPATVNLTLGAVTAGSTGGLSFTYFTDAAATVSYPTPTTATTGTYYIVGATVGGCSDTTAVTVTINPSPTVVTNDPAAVCSPATVDLTAPAVTAGSTGGLVYTYFLDAGATIPYGTPAVTSASGTYYIVGTIGGCSDIEPVTVTINPQPTVVAAPLSLCLDATVDLTDPSVTVGSTPGLTFTYFMDPGATIPVPDPTAVGAGTYYIVGTTGAGCSNITSIDVSIAPEVITTDQAVCSPLTTTNLTLPSVTLGSTPGLTFTYFSDAPATIPVADPTAVVAGTYYIVGTTADGCADTTAVIFTVNPKPTVITVPQSACAPATVDLTLAGVTAGSDPFLSFSYFTNAAATIVYGTPATASAGTYYIVGTTVFGCSDTTSVLVTIDPQPTVVTVNQSACLPISTTDLTLPAVTTGSTPGLIFTYYTDPGASIPVADPTAVGAGTYYIVGTIPGGCSNIAAVTFTVNSKPTVLTVPQSTCSPGTINITLPPVTAGSTGGLIFTYFTDAAATITFATPTTAGNGTYYIVGSTGAGCSDTTAIVVTIDPKPTIVTTQQSLCSPATTADLTAAGVTAGSTVGLSYTYFTDPGATSPYGTPTLATAGTYYIVGASVASCSDTASVVVTINPKPSVVTVPQTICNPATTVDITLPAATAGSTIGLSFTYFTDAGATSTFATPTVATSGTYYIVGIVPATGCADTTGITVTVNTKPTVITNDPPPICSPVTVDLTLPAVTLGSTGGLTFSYFTDAGATAVYPTPGTAVAGTYYIVGVTIAGCSDTTAVNVVSDAIPTVVTVPQSACAPSISVDLTLPAVTAGSTAGLTFTYFTNAGATIPVPDETAATTGTYYIVGTTAGGCADTTSVVVTIDPGANAGTVTGISPLCVGAADTYVSDGDPGGSWSSTNPLIATVVAGTGLVTAVSSGTTDITYTVVGCNGTFSSLLTLTVDPTNSGTVSGTTPLCIGATDIYTSDGNPGGTWASTNPLIASVNPVTGEVTALSAGTTDITYTLIGCSTSSLLTLTVSPNANAGIVSGTTPLCIGASDTYTTNGDPGGSWSSTNPLIATVIAGTGFVTAVSAGTTDITYTVAGCNGPASGFMTLTVSPDVNAGVVSGTTPLCIGATDTYTSAGDAGGTWSSTNLLIATVNGVTGLVSTLSAGTTDITYTVNGCNGPASSFLTLTVDPDANPGTISGTSPLCIGSTDIYTSDGEIGGTWSSTNPLVASVIPATGLVTAISAGTTDITYTISTGCNNPISSILTLTVSPDASAGIISGNTPLCMGTSDTYTSDGDLGGTWSSTNPLIATVIAGTGLVSAVSAGTTDITYTVAGCNGPASSFLTLTVDPTNSGTVSGTTPLCIGATDPYTSDGDPGGTWASTNPLVASVIAGTGVVTALTAGTTDITYTLIGCSSASFLTLTVDPDVNAGAISGISPLCIGTSDTYTSNGDLGGSWTSTNPLVATVNPVSGLVSALIAGTTDITYTVSGCNGPVSSILTLTVDPINSGTVSGTTPLCIGATDPFTSDGTPGGTWASTNPLVASVVAGTGVVTALSAGTTDITYTLAGCGASSSLTLTIDPDANAGNLSVPSPLCIGSSDTYTTDGDAGGTWSSSNPVVATVVALTGVVTAVSAGTSDITYTVNGCNGPASASLTLTVLPDVNAGVVSGTSPLCIGSTDTYTSNGDLLGSWSSTDPLIATVNILTGLVTPVSAGTTNITYTVIGCNGPASAFLTLTVDPDASSGIVSGTSPLCIGATDTYASNGDLGGSWSSTNPLVATVIAGTGVVTAVSAGTSDITYTISSGCNNPASSFLTLTVSPNVNAGIISGNSPLCIGATDNYSSNGDAGGTWSSTNPLVATVIAGTGVVTAVSPGTSDITYTVNGCNGPASALLTLTVSPDVNAGVVSGTTPLCIGATDTYTSTGDPGGSWSSTNPLIATVVAGTGLVTAISAGTTDITYTINGCNGPASAFSTLTVNPDANAGIVSGTTPLCIGSTDTYTSNGDAGGSWSSTNPLIATVIAGTGLVTAVSAGTTDITYTISSGCNNPVSAFLTLTVSPNVNAGTVSGITPLCASLTNTYTSNGDAGGTWSSTTPAVATVVAGTGVVSALSSGTTDITYTVNGCNGPASAFLSLTVNSSPVVTATGINLTCFNVCNGNAIASVVGGNPLYTYAWSSGISDTIVAATDTLKALCIGGYTVTVTDANGCFDIDSITITQPTQLIPNITTGNISCYGVCDGASESSPTGGTAPYTFAWNTGSVDTLITNLCPGTYTVIVTDSLGCTSTLPDTIVQAAAVLSNAIITNAACGLCDGQIVLSPSGGISPYTFLWGSGQTGDTETNLCSGLYAVNITDSAGCSSSYSIPVSNPGGPTSSTIISTNISCFGLCDGAVTALVPIGGTPPYSFLWIQGGQTTSTLSNLCAGVYYVQIADSVGCSLIDSVIITEPTQVVVNQFITAATCGSCDGGLSVAPSGGAAPYSVLWSTGSASDTLTGLCAGFYSVQITDSVGCSQNIVMPLNSQNAPTLSTSSVPLLCNAACNATATVVATGGTAPYTYLWNDAGAQTTDVATALCAGTYFVQVTGAGCVSFAAVSISDPDPIGFAFANAIDPLCNGNTNGSIAIIPFGGTLPYTFSWTGSGSVSDTASGLSAGVYTVTVTDANGCTSSQTNTLLNPDSLTISNVPTPASCNTIADGAIDVTVGGGSPGYTYQWSGGSALTTQDLTGILIGAYSITVTDTNGCTITDNILLTSTVTVTAKAGNDTAFCEPGTMLLSAAGSSANVTNYQWFQLPANTPVGNVMNVLLTPPTGATDYYVIVDNGAGCAHSDTVTVTTNGLPLVNAGSDVTIIATSSTVIGGNPTGPAGSTYSWDPLLGLDNGANANPVASPASTTSYTVTVTSPQGCVSSDVVIVTVVANITFANGISPNSDGANDEWIIDNIELFPNSVVEVYNRWGELLFQSTGYTDKWKGMFKGKPLPVGTYYYIINLNDPLFPDALTGPITILR